MNDYYADDKVFRTGVEPNMEVLCGWKPGDVIVSIDSYDAPEASVRLTPEVVAALAAWLSRRQEDA